jgi:hypothetical protein
MRIKVSLLSEFKSYINLSPNDNFSKLEWLMLFLIVQRLFKIFDNNTEIHNISIIHLTENLKFIQKPFIKISGMLKEINF